MGKTNLIREIKDGQVEYVGPMRIILIDSTAKSLWAGLFSCWTLLLHLFIGATVTFTVQYMYKVLKKGLKSLNNLDYHILWCTIGYQVLIAEAILTLNSYNGWTVFFRPIHKKRAHWILQIIGSICALTGTVSIIETNMNTVSLHGCVGVLAGACTILSLSNGVCALYAYEIGCNKLWKIFHALFGISVIFFSSASFALGIMEEYKMYIRFVKEIKYVIIGFAAFFATGILILPLLRLFGF